MGCSQRDFLVSPFLPSACVQYPYMYPKPRTTAIRSIYIYLYIYFFSEKLQLRLRPVNHFTSAPLFFHFYYSSSYSSAVKSIRPYSAAPPVCPFCVPYTLLMPGFFFRNKYRSFLQRLSAESRESFFSALPYLHIAGL